jgi:hypothetical protein
MTRKGKIMIEGYYPSFKVVVSHNYDAIVFVPEVALLF